VPTTAVLFVDLDDFKDVNDGLGHLMGDLLLCQVAERLSAAVRDEDLVARLGGDEFAVLVEDAKDRDAITAAAQQLITALERPFAFDGLSLEVKASIGIATGDTADSAQQLIRDADIAMYAAKLNGKGQYAWFVPAMRARAVDRWTLRSDLAVALRRNELIVEYQPIIDLADGRINGAEALVRWQHPTRGLIGPTEFIPVAEQTGLITDIGDWVLRTAATEASRWRSRSGTQIPLYVSVNVSALQLRDHSMVERVASALAHSGLPAHALTLELTESLLMDDVEMTRSVLQELRDLGVSIAVDDFGTGYSSLAYLRQFPVDLLKIDRSFVSDIGTRPEARTLAADIVTLARALGVTSVAEGIETQEQLALLRSMGCTLGQGYLLGRPMSAEQLVRRLHEQPAVAVQH
jgi:diguanylate cyclase (GGDEF)-like protein